MQRAETNCLSSSSSNDQSRNYTLAGAGLNHSDRRGAQESIARHDGGTPRLFWVHTLGAGVESDRVERPSRCSLHTSQLPWFYLSKF
ncbi:hypothetical protein K443DRAFT_676143 [Laccaria amethystina LaAM-08-1]|uniref:Uncharacterized protein n=1 Tax=Laccaria amethystina LaAM-08-1 TaxID=1095629 RepID=A0A0C9XR76_9AGAR|nr:hypothetical protein K443DRAFT_676143 [Laccaria amethystina LaAM-08-1]